MAYGAYGQPGGSGQVPGQDDQQETYTQPNAGPLDGGYYKRGWEALPSKFQGTFLSDKFRKSGTTRYVKGDGPVGLNNLFNRQFHDTGSGGHLNQFRTKGMDHLTNLPLARSGISDQGNLLSSMSYRPTDTSPYEAIQQRAEAFRNNPQDTALGQAQSQRAGLMDSQAMNQATAGGGSMGFRDLLRGGAGRGALAAAQGGMNRGFQNQEFLDKARSQSRDDLFKAGGMMDKLEKRDKDMLAKQSDREVAHNNKLYENLQKQAAGEQLADLGF